MKDKDVEVFVFLIKLRSDINMDDFCKIVFCDDNVYVVVFDEFVFVIIIKIVS